MDDSTQSSNFSTILEKYKERLIDISTKNKALLFRGVTNKKLASDLALLPSLSVDLETWLFSRSIHGLIVSPSSFVTDLDSTLTNKTLIGMHDGETGFSDFKSNMTDISKSATALERETGRNLLYVGYPFLKGIFEDGTHFRAPVFLFPVSIDISSKKVTFTHLVDSEIVLNRVLFLSLTKYSGIDFDIPSYELESLNELGISDISTLDTFLRGLNLDFVSDPSGYAPIDRYKKSEFNTQRGMYILERNVVLGLFHIVNSVYSDYKHLEGKDLGASIEALVGLNKLQNSESKEWGTSSGLSNMDTDLGLITALDSSQELAVYKAMHSNNLVIYGPPGTGKSQVIANIISNSLFNGKKVLMVSQKKSALDVVFSRLGVLNLGAMLLTDAGKDKKLFYSTLSNAIATKVSHDVSLAASIQNDLDTLSTSSKTIFSDLTALHTCLTEPTSSGLSLSTMYKVSKPVDWKALRAFASSTLLAGVREMQYSTLESSINSLCKDTVVNAYTTVITARELFPYIDFIMTKSKFDIFEVVDLLSSLQTAHDSALESRRLLSERHSVDTITSLSSCTPDSRLAELYKFVEHQSRSDLHTLGSLERLVFDTPLDFDQDGLLPLISEVESSLGFTFDSSVFGRDLYSLVNNSFDTVNNVLILPQLEQLLETKVSEDFGPLLSSVSELGELLNLDLDKYPTLSHESLQGILPEVSEILGFSFNTSIFSSVLYPTVLRVYDYDSNSVDHMALDTLIDERVKDVFKQLTTSIEVFSSFEQTLQGTYTSDDPLFHDLRSVVSDQLGYSFDADILEDSFYPLVSMVFDSETMSINYSELKLLVDLVFNFDFRDLLKSLNDLSSELDSIKSLDLNDTLLDHFSDPDLLARVEQALGYSYDKNVSNRNYYQFVLDAISLDGLDPQTTVLDSVKLENLALDKCLSDCKQLVFEIDSLKKWSVKKIFSNTKNDLESKSNQLDKLKDQYKEDVLAVANILLQNKIFLSKLLETKIDAVSSGITHKALAVKNGRASYKTRSRDVASGFLTNMFFVSALEEHVSNSLAALHEEVTLKKSNYTMLADHLVSVLQQNRFFRDELQTYISTVLQSQFREKVEHLNSIRHGMLSESKLISEILTQNGLFLTALSQLRSAKVANLKSLFDDRVQSLQNEMIPWFTAMNELTALKDSFVEKTSHDILDHVLSLLDSGERLTSLSDLLLGYSDTLPALRLVNSLPPASLSLLNYAVKAKDATTDSVSQSLNELKNLYLAYNIELEELKSGAILDSIEQFNFLITRLEGYQNVRTKGIKHVILSSIYDDVKMQLDNYSNSMSEFSRQASKTRGLLPVRKFCSTYWNLLSSLFPVWLLTPEVASQVLPLQEGLFDLVIFDEASQLYVESALPSIYRGKSVIVSGDDKQLRPTNVFSGRYDSVLDESEEDSDLNAALEEKSLLDLAKVNYDSVSLMYHYRSKYSELINFSNYAFYNGRLKLAPNVIKQGESVSPIERIKVNGIWNKGVNELEARAVVSLVSELLRTRRGSESIGIITFNSSQKDLVENLLYDESLSDPSFASLYLSEVNRVENNEDFGLFVKNIENVQGDERDIIIFSTGYAPNQYGKLNVNFGSLSQDGGENRLNVAVSRAKEKVYLVTSIEPEHLNVDNSKNRGPQLLKTYLYYVRAVSVGDHAFAEELLFGLCPVGLSDVSSKRFDSPFEEQVHNALVEHGYEVETQVGVMGYRIDLAVYDRANGVYLAGIECDGATYHSSKSARERDIDRQRFLESRGWKILRVWSRNWWKSSNSEIKKLILELEGIREGSSKKAPVTVDFGSSHPSDALTLDYLEGLKVSSPIDEHIVPMPLDTCTQEEISGKRLRYVSLDNVLYELPSWGGCLVFILQYLAKSGLTLGALDMLDETTSATSGWIRTSEEGMRQPKSLEYLDLFVDTHGSAWQNFTRIKKATTLLEESKRNLVFYLEDGKKKS